MKAEMYYALVCYSEIEFQHINIIRKKYDPTFNIVDPHITILFPVPETVGQENLINHITTIVKNQRPFPIHIYGFEKSWDNWLFLCLKRGNDEIVSLYKELYKGILQKYQRSDIEFIPHISLGLFVK